MKIADVLSMTITRGCPEEGDAPGFVFETPRSYYYGNNDVYRAIPVEDCLVEVETAMRKEGFREGIIRRGVLNGQPHYTFRAVEDVVKRTPAPVSRVMPHGFDHLLAAAGLNNASGKSGMLLQALLPRGYASDIDSNIFAAPKAAVTVRCKCGAHTDGDKKSKRCSACGTRAKLRFATGKKVSKEERAARAANDPKRANFLSVGALNETEYHNRKAQLLNASASPTGYEELLRGMSFGRSQPTALGGEMLPLHMQSRVMGRLNPFDGVEGRQSPIRTAGESEIRHRGPTFATAEQRAVEYARMFSQYQASSAFVTTHESRHGRLMAVPAFGVGYLGSVTESTFRQAEALFNVKSYEQGKGIAGVMLTPYTAEQQRYIDEFESGEFPQVLAHSIGMRIRTDKFKRKPKSKSKKKGKK